VIETSEPAASRSEALRAKDFIREATIEARITPGVVENKENSALEEGKGTFLE
jgi:hypothetical protein